MDGVVQVLVVPLCPVAFTLQNVHNRLLAVSVIVPSPLLEKEGVLHLPSDLHENPDTGFCCVCLQGYVIVLEFVLLFARNSRARLSNSLDELLEGQPANSSMQIIEKVSRECICDQWSRSQRSQYIVSGGQRLKQKKKRNRKILKSDFG
ncbi:MAG: hypothetical protein KDK34_14490 [Leptospiraceae bacterium]|nr:hypothetical protein [Leptospiraceae bacterium]